MNLRKGRRKKQGEEILLSPIIDCVFLMLIFFLVTSMIKRFERQIPVTLSDDTSAITPEPFDDSFPVGVDPVGTLYGPTGKKSQGVAKFGPLADSEAFFQTLIRERGRDRPLTVVVQKGTPFQRVIDVQDRLELIGFEAIRFRIRDFPLSDDFDSQRKHLQN